MQFDSEPNFAVACTVEKLSHCFKSETQYRKNIKPTDLSLLDYCWVHTSQSVVELVLVLMVDKGFHLIVDHVA